MSGYRTAIPLAAILCASCTHEKRVTVATPHAPTVWQRQIHNAADAGDGDMAMMALRNRVAAEPNSVAARVELARAYRERGYQEVALDVCRLTVERFPESTEAQFALVRTLFEMKRPADAIAALEAHPRQTSEYYSWLGLIQDSTGAWGVGEPSHRKAVELAPAQDAPHNNLGYNLLMQKKNAEAAAEFREALRLNPGSALARNNLGLALASINTAEAVSNWQTASDPATAHNNLATVWIEKGNWDEARKELAIALGYNRSHPAALRNLALLSELDGKPAAVPAQSEGVRPGNWKARVKRLFVGPLEE